MSGPSLSTQAHRLQATGRTKNLPALIYLTDPVRFPDPRAAVLTLPRGAAVILRHYGSPGREALARALLAICRRRGLKLLIAGDPGLALRLRADGVHWPEALVRPRARLLPWLVTAAAHSCTGLVNARRCRVDAALLSPVFATGSGPGKRPLGLMRFTALATSTPLPVYALGGIDAATAGRLRSSGAAGLAAISGLTGVASEGATTL